MKRFSTDCSGMTMKRVTLLQAADQGHFAIGLAHYN
jgi:hypothetical protein